MSDRDALLNDVEGAAINATADTRQQSVKMRRSRVLVAVALVLLVALGVILAVTLTPHNSETIAAQPLRVVNAAVASEERTCSQIGSDILEVYHGNAVDAVIATALCIGVINNFASGIGGGGFLLLQKPGAQTEFYDFREMAPAAAHENMFVENFEASTIGGLASGVPGELKGMQLAFQNYASGNLQWADLFAPSIKLARFGFVATPLLVKRLQDYDVLSLCQSSSLWNETYCPNGTLVDVGDYVYRTKLADTLEAIANAGNADPFYFGAIANVLVEDINDAGGNMTLEDFANYFAAVRVPQSTWYHGSEILTGPAPSSGPVLIDILNILEGFRLGESAAKNNGPTSLDYHHIVEAMKFGFAQRSLLGDPDYVNITAIVADMVSKEFASKQRANISDTQTFPPEYYGSDYFAPPTPGTTHISALDNNGFAAAFTSTVNLVWGSKVMSRTGIILNNQMDDFSTPNKTNSFGIAPSPNNFIKPGKRPLSSATPTIIRYNDQIQMVVGASGGTRIITSTLLTILNNLDFKMNIQASVNAGRIHHQLYPNEIQAEYNVSATLLEELESYGHVVNRLAPGNYPAAVQAIANGFDGYIYAASDPRKDGLAAGY